MSRRDQASRALSIYLSLSLSLLRISFSLIISLPRLHANENAEDVAERKIRNIQEKEEQNSILWMYTVKFLSIICCFIGGVMFFVKKKKKKNNKRNIVM